MFASLLPWDGGTATATIDDLQTLGRCAYLQAEWKNLDQQPDDKFGASSNNASPATSGSSSDVRVSKYVDVLSAWLLGRLGRCSSEQQ